MHFEVKDGPFAHVEWLLGAVVGEEALSELFTFHLTLASPTDAVVEASHAELEDGLIGRAVSLSMHAEDETRHGIIASLDISPRRDDARGAVLRVVMRPRAWLLTLRKNTRIFQGLYVHEIVSQVLTESDVCHRWLLEHTYPKRVYCTQYEETDYAFVSRILAEEGIFWFFEQAAAFAPSPAPADAPSDPLATVGAIGTVLGAVAGGIAPLAESSAVGGGIIGTVGSLGSIVGDAATASVDPEADDPIHGTTGKGGPASKTPTEVLVFADTAIGYASGHRHDSRAPLTLRYGAATSGTGADAVTSLSGVRTAGPRAVEIRDYDFRRPMALLSKTDTMTEVSALTAPLEFYEHHGEYEKPDIELEQAKIRLDQLRAPTSIIKGESSCPRMAAGFGVDLTHAPAPFRDGKFVPVRVLHEAYARELGTGDEAARDAGGDQVRTLEAVALLLHELESIPRRLGSSELRAISRRAFQSSGTPGVSYQNRFEWVGHNVVFRPPLPPRIRHAVNESAVVVGPAGKAIYADHYGRVKVQFHWDREHVYNENSSCWIRVLSTWAGAGYGFQFLPRVGMEVVVTFLGGDPDRPVVSGTMYNATHPTPEPLPQRLTRSGLRSQTVPGGGGFNEFSFEDAQGVERVFIHAQKDLHEIVNDAHTTTVRGPQTTTVGGTQKLGVAADRIAAIANNDAEIVGSNKAAQVGGNRVERVAKNSTQVVHGDALREVRGVSIAESVSDDLHVVRGDRSLTVHGRHVLHVVSKQEGPKSSATTYVDGSSYHTATDKVVIRAQHADASGSDSSVRLECGESYIEIAGDTITLFAKNIALKSSENFTLDGKNVDLSGSDHIKLGRSEAAVELTAKGFTVGGVKKAELATDQSKMSLDGGKAELTGSSETTIKSSQIKLAGGSASDTKKASSQSQDDPTPPTSHLKLAFVHPHGTTAAEPIRSTRYRLTSDGFVHEAATDGDGAIDVEVPQGTTRAQVVLFVNESTDYRDRYAAPLVWDFTIESNFHAATDAQGARIRLRNLGYATGTQLDVTSLEDDPVTVQAIEQFQRDEGIRISGKLEEDQTGTTLNTVYGEVQ